MIKRYFLFISSILLYSQSFGQVVGASASIKQLHTYEDSLVSLSNKFLNSENEQDRKSANETFLKTLDATLKIKGPLNVGLLDG